jgi:hypothetical protein
VHCSRVFRSSVPSDALPSSPCERPSGNAQGEHGITRSMEWGVGPGGGVPHRGGCSAGTSIAGHILEGTLPGSVRSQGRVTVRDPELGSHVLSAPRRAWNPHREHWRAVRTRGRARAAGRKLRRLPMQRSPEVSPGSSSGSTPTRPSTSPSSSTAVNVHSADSPCHRADSRHHRGRGQQAPQQAQLP